jgi:putative transcriptional regulator
MDKQLFDDLLNSLKQAKAISKGKAKTSRRVKVEDIDVKAIRESVELTQVEFAKLMRVSIKTLQNWEQLRRRPTGPAAALLRIVSASPQLALESLRG